MKTILLNGSPKGNTQSSGSYFLAKAFASGMKEPCEIRSVYKEDRWELLQYVSQFERIIFFTPNYIHSIPYRKGQKGSLSVLSFSRGIRKVQKAKSQAAFLNGLLLVCSMSI